MKVAFAVLGILLIYLALTGKAAQIVAVFTGGNSSGVAKTQPDFGGAAGGAPGQTQKLPNVPATTPSSA